MKKTWINPDMEILNFAETANSYQKDEAPDGETFYAEGIGWLDHKGICCS